MNSRGFTITLILLSIAVVTLLATGGILVYKYRSAIDEANTLRAEKAAAQKRATDLALLWAGAVETADRKAHERVSEAQRRYDSLLARAQSVDRGAGVRIGHDVHGLLLDATRHANSLTPAPKEYPAPAADLPQPAPATSVVYDSREFATYVVTAAQAYQDAVGQWRACTEFYNDLRTKEQLH
jgi:type II secretory pathway pseudopilin PulG